MELGSAEERCSEGRKRRRMDSSLSNFYFQRHLLLELCFLWLFPFRGFPQVETDDFGTLTRFGALTEVDPD